MDAEQLRERRIRLHRAQRAELRILLRKAGEDGDTRERRALLDKLAWIDRQLKDFGTTARRKAA